MRHGENADFGTEFDEYQGIRKPREQSASDIQSRSHVEKTGERHGTGANQHQGAFDLFEEL
jgi:hypothetical protein